MKVIAISGKKRSGKDFSNILLQKKLPNSKSFAFADCLKVTIAALVNDVNLYDENIKTSYVKDFFALRNCEDNSILDVGMKDKFINKEENSKNSKTKLTPLTYVELMQYFGKKFKSDFGNEVFIIRTMKEIDFISSSLSDDSVIIITDLRLKVEYNYLKNRFGKDLITLRINSTQSPESKDVSEVDLDKHEFDYLIDNSKRDEKDLSDKLDKFLHEFGIICPSNNN